MVAMRSGKDGFMSWNVNPVQSEMCLAFISKKLGLPINIYMWHENSDHINILNLKYSVFIGRSEYALCKFLFYFII